MPLQKFYTSAVFAAGLSLASFAPSALAAEFPNPAARFPATVADHGRLDPSKQIDILVHMARTNEEGFQKTLADLYDKNSPIYHKWLTDEDLKQYEPSADKIAAVRSELASHGLSIVSADRHNFTLRARGTVANMEAAFGTELHEFEGKNGAFRANVKDARLGGAAGNYVALVSGLESHQIHPMLVRAVDFKTGKPHPPIPLAKVHPDSLSSMFTDQALSAEQTFNVGPTNYNPNDTATAVYSGDIFDNSGLPVTFLPNQLQAAYGLPAAYSLGLTGKGQTIVLLEGYGYPTAESDANTYFSLTGDLAPLTASTFSIIYPDGIPLNPNAAAATDWDFEIALDISSAHTIAPGAKIVEVNANGQDDIDFLSAMGYIIDNNVGYTVSDSWEEDDEYFSGPAEGMGFDIYLQMAAAKGISFQFSSGDSGDNGVGSPIGAAGIPSNAPHGTGVGGTSLVNTPTGFRSTGWGLTINDVWDDFEGVYDPPTPPNEYAFFVWGGGGGISHYFSKPSWQSGLKISGRGVPDVSALADPYTGVALVLTEGGEQSLYYEVGGTSLASPIFTAFWAIADQNNGGKPLGQAAPILSTLNNYHLTDVTPFTPSIQAVGSITDSNGTIAYSDAQLFKGAIYGNTGWTGTLYPISDGTDLEIIYAWSFGLDSSLVTSVGWDDVTGYGTPNGVPFLNGAIGK